MTVDDRPRHRRVPPRRARRDARGGGRHHATTSGTLPTPCEDWDVRALLNHVVAGQLVGVAPRGGRDHRGGRRRVRRRRPRAVATRRVPRVGGRRRPRVRGTGRARRAVRGVVRPGAGLGVRGPSVPRRRGPRLGPRGRDRPALPADARARRRVLAGPRAAARHAARQRHVRHRAARAPTAPTPPPGCSSPSAAHPPEPQPSTARPAAPAWGTLPAVPTSAPPSSPTSRAVVALWDRAAGPDPPRRPATTTPSGCSRAIPSPDRRRRRRRPSSARSSSAGTAGAPTSTGSCVAPEARRRGHRRALVVAAAARARRMRSARSGSTRWSTPATPARSSSGRAAGFSVEGDDRALVARPGDAASTPRRRRSRELLGRRDHRDRGHGGGTINTVVGSGSLITFPMLLTLGYPPVLANVSNNIGLVPGAISGVYGYRRELVGQRGRIMRLAPLSARRRAHRRAAAARAAERGVQARGRGADRDRARARGARPAPVAPARAPARGPRADLADARGARRPRRDLRRLLRRRAGDHPHRAARDLRARRPPAPQRDEERARDDGEPRRLDRVRLRDPRRLGGRRVHRRRFDRRRPDRRDRSGAASTHGRCGS